jgi:CBS domain-containing protein
MSEAVEEDLERWEEASGPSVRRLDNRALLRPISTLDYPKNPASVGPAVPVGKALETMAARNLGALLVVEGGRLVGIFSERDALRKGLYAGASADRPVREFMTAKPEVLTPHDPIALAMNRMGMGAYRHVPLVDNEGRPVGLLVMRDVVRYIVRFFPDVALNVPPHSVHEPPERNVEGG